MAYQDYSNQKDQFKDVIDYCKGLKVGDKIRFMVEKKSYTIKAKSDKFLICTKPFNLKNTVLYTIIDLERLVRGANNLIFNPYDYTSEKDMNDCIVDLESGKTEVSHRNCVKLDVQTPVTKEAIAFTSKKEIQNGWTPRMVQDVFGICLQCTNFPKNCDGNECPPHINKDECIKCQARRL